MQLWILPALLALSIVICLAAGIWLLLHLTALTALFEGKADLAASPKPPRASRQAVIAALLLFGGGLVGVFVAQILAMSA